ncbi:E3 SUMO-protein ligase NSE2-like [Euwallacea fornicatus]|uniref:E3 SUMO-protein ligase NSE2-like n=1 Tax=Euwallacea fornicatus TaxID=995702 RepID=UPI0033905E89
MSLHDRYSIFLDKCVNSLTTWKNFINENLEDPEKEVEVAKLKEIAQKFCTIDNKYQNSKKAIILVEETISDPSQDYLIDELYQQKLSTQSETVHTDHEIWDQLFHNNCSILEVVPKNSQEDSTYEDIGDSLMCSTSFTLPLDPIRKGVIRKPLRNIKCKHIYDSETIYDYIRQSKKKAMCPYIGCKNNKLTPADLQEDLLLEKQILRHIATQGGSSRNEEEEMDTSGSDNDD